MWEVMRVIAFNGDRGIAEDMLTGVTKQFSSAQVKKTDLTRLVPGSTIIITQGGYIESAVGNFIRHQGLTNVG